MTTRHEWLRDPANLIEAIHQRFADVERLDLRVDRIFVHRDTAAVIERFDGQHFDAANWVIRKLIPGFIGHLWGAGVYVDANVVQDHIVAVPSDMEVRILGPACGVAL